MRGRAGGIGIRPWKASQNSSAERGKSAGRKSRPSEGRTKLFEKKTVNLIGVQHLTALKEKPHGGGSSPAVPQDSSSGGKVSGRELAPKNQDRTHFRKKAEGE